MSYLSAFTTQSCALSKELVRLFPQDKYLRMADNGISLMKSVHPRKLCDLFAQFFRPYKEKIMARDETFFIQHEFKEIQSTFNSQQDTVCLIMKQLKAHWATMSDVSKKATWDYLTVLLKLTELIQNPQANEAVST